MWINLALMLLVLVSVAAWALMPAWGTLALLLLLALWLLLTRRGRQALSVAGVGVSTLRQRLGSSAVVVVGIAGVVAVLVSLLAMAEGYRQTLRNSGSEDTAIVMRGGSSSEVTSTLDRESIVVIEQAPQIARDAKGEALASAEIVVAATLPNAGAKDADDSGSVQLRGVSDKAFALRPQLKITEGRRIKPGLRELMAGRGAVRQFQGLEVGREVKLGNEVWTVVGHFSSGDAMESELWGDATTVADTYRRGASRNVVQLKLAKVADFKALKSELESNPQLKVEVSTTLDYFSKQSEGMSKVITTVGITVGAIMAVGAIFGALNTMFAAVASRAREIATLRAIGFQGLPVVVAVLLETMLLALIGGLVGAAIAWLMFNGRGASTLAGGAVGKLSFELLVTPALMGAGLKWALAIGFVGGLFPAMRAARMPVTTALREA